VKPDAVTEKIADLVWRICNSVQVAHRYSNRSFGKREAHAMAVRPLRG
jgi:hypothetical protein